MELFTSCASKSGALILDPAKTTDFPADYAEKVRQVHSVGGWGSQGYKYDWKLEEAQKNILRTHLTGLSARMLCKLGKEKVRY